MSVFFTKEHMNKIMGMFCPEGENIITAAYAVGKETEINQYFGGCENVGDRLVPADKDNIIKVLKRKVCIYDMYIGYTEKSLIISECDMTTKYFYQIEDVTDPAFVGIKKLDKEISHKNIGKVLPLESIKELQIKKGWFGSLRCILKLENGTYFKFLMAKQVGGITGKMPDHRENRDKLLEELKKYCKV